MSTIIWPRDMESYEIEGLIGSGGFAKVFKGRFKTNNIPCAIKVIELEDLDLELEDIYKEVRTMNICDHPNLVHYYACFIINSDLYIVMPYMALGSCKRIIEELKVQNIAFKEEWISAIMNEVSKGLAYLHTKGFIHRDVKSSNILIDSDGNVKLSDFGVAGVFDISSKTNEKCRTFVGTPCWMAPEVLEHTRYSEISDTWSFGITLLELAKGYPPYAKEQPMKAMYLTLQSPPPSLLCYPSDSDFSPSFEKCYSQCLVKDPNNRPKMSVISNHKFLTQSKLPCLSELVRLIKPIEINNNQSTDRKSRFRVTSIIDGKLSSQLNPSAFVPGSSWTFDVSPNDSEDIDFSAIGFGMN